MKERRKSNDNSNIFTNLVSVYAYFTKNEPKSTHNFYKNQTLKALAARSRTMLFYFMINAKEILIRCSNIYLIMQNEKGTYFTEADQRKIDHYRSRTKPLTLKMEEELSYLFEKKENSLKPKLSESCKNYLRSLYLISRYGNRYSFLSDNQGVPQMIRGIKQEDWAVKMLSDFRGKQYFRNKKKLTNEYLIGSADIFDHKDISKATSVTEIKTKGTIGDFNKRIGAELEESHRLQIQGYLSLSGKELGEVVYCLVPPPENIIQEQKELFYNLDKNKDNPNADEKWAKIEKDIRFEDIPLNEKIISYKVERDNKLIDEINQRVEICREWILEFEKFHLDWLNENK